MAFIPLSWNPGYAVPGYVRAEGLQTRAFVTKQKPRGTYDDPGPPTWSRTYAVPGYITAEPIGQGAQVTKWEPRGTFHGFGGVDGLGADTPMPPAYARYGHEAAKRLLNGIARLPPSARKAHLKKTMDAIDPKLWNRTRELATRYQAAGMRPAMALHAGLSRAMSTGILSEIVEAGRTGRPPAARSMLGMGCYGCAAVLGALGDAATPKAGNTASLAAQMLAAKALPAGGECSADGKFVWDISAGPGYGFWRRLRVGEPCITTGVFTGPTPGQGPSGGVVVNTWPLSSGGITTSGPGGMASPFVLTSPVPARLNYIIDSPGKIPMDAAAYLKTVLTTDYEGAGKNMGTIDQMLIADAYLGPTNWVGTGQPINKGESYFQNAPALDQAYRAWFAAMGITSTTPIYLNMMKLLATTANQGGGGELPVAVFKNAGEDWGIWMAFWAGMLPGTAQTNTINLSIMIDSIAANRAATQFQLFNFMKAIVGDLGQLACQLVNSSGGVAGGAAVGGPVGAAGVGIAQQACGQPPPAVVAPETDYIPLILAGGAVLAAALLWPKKRAAP